MEKKVDFSVSPPCHNHIEQQAAIFISWRVVVGVQDGFRGHPGHSSRWLPEPSHAVPFCWALFQETL